MRIGRLLGTAALVATLALTAACGADDEAPEAEESPTATASSSPTEAVTTSSAPEPSTPTASETTTEPTAETSSSEPTTDPTDPTDEEIDLTRAPETYAEAEAHVEAAGIDGSNTTATRFSTPRDVVYCVLQHEFIEPSCELRTGMVKDPEVCGRAPSDLVGRVVLTPRGAEPECNTDTIREPGADVVPPSGVVRAGGVTCAVESIGVTCIDGSRGFFITEGDYAVF